MNSAMIALTTSLAGVRLTGKALARIKVSASPLTVCPAATG
jgi:hypothetical protein